jgi:NMD protein affecting ribosome stability and mRNA decay
MNENVLLKMLARVATKACKSCGNTDIIGGDGLCQSCHERKISEYKLRSEKAKEEISDAFKWAVWERDNFTCQECGSRRNLSVDHIRPESKGGKLTMENAQTLCMTCNRKKGAR